jgi:TfoX/Sxy family transcriptional regulator of competence genes
MTMPKPSEQAKAAFQRLVPPDPAVTTRPMFGNLAAFVNGKMFSGLFGEDLFVRVSDEDQAKIRKEGGKAFEPMPGRPMTGYVTVASDWQKKPDTVRSWIIIALTWSKALPAKKATRAKGAKAAKAASQAPPKKVAAPRPR